MNLHGMPMRKLSLISFAAVLLCLSMFAGAQVVPMAREAAEELVEWMLKQGGAHADDVAKLGGPAAAREAVEDVAKVVGKETAEQVVRRGGPGAIVAVRGLDDLAPVGARLIATHGVQGTLVVQQGGRASVELFKKYGDDAVRILADQGAEAGSRMLGFAGESLAKWGKRLSPEGQAHLRQFVPALEKADGPLRSAFLDKLAAGGDDFLMWISRRWKQAAVAGGLTVAVITAYKVGDGVAEGVRGVAAALPNPGENPLAWFTWWMPVLALAAIVVGGWVLRAKVSARKT
jgi:hypothetical protein